jgi:hypothetical protein
MDGDKIQRIVGYHSFIHAFIGFIACSNFDLHHVELVLLMEN